MVTFERLPESQQRQGFQNDEQPEVFLVAYRRHPGALNVRSERGGSASGLVAGRQRLHPFQIGRHGAGDRQGVIDDFEGAGACGHVAAAEFELNQRLFDRL